MAGHVIGGAARAATIGARVATFAASPSSMSAAGVALLEACPPTVVEHCLSACLTGATDLVVARSTSLELYTLHEERAVATASRPAKGGQTLDGIASAQLRFVARMTLNGSVASMVTVASPGDGGGDRLLISFADAKVALVDFDAEAHALRTLAAHSFEALDEQVGCWDTGFPVVQALRSRPVGVRCINIGPHLRSVRQMAGGPEETRL